MSYESSYWLTFKQAKKRGGSVCRGEKGMPVVLWRWREADEQDEDQRTTKRQIPILRYYTVFNVAQCEGIDVPGESADLDFQPIAQCEDVAARILEITAGAGVDRIVEVDFGRNLPVTQAVLKENSTIACYASMSDPTPTLPFYPLMFRNFNLRLVLVYSMSVEAKQQACQDIVQACEAGQLSHAIAARFPLEQLAEAHEAVEGGQAIGNVVVEIGRA